MSYYLVCAELSTWHSDGGFCTVCCKDDLPLLGGLKDPPLLLHLEPPVQLEAQHMRVSTREKNKKISLI
jgi:hypothetical protein